MNILDLTHKTLMLRDDGYQHDCNDVGEVRMIDVDIPGFRKCSLEHLVLDYNGTLAVDGTLISGVAEALKNLSGRLSIHILTADTFGMVHAQTSGIPSTVSVLPRDRQDKGKGAYVKKLGFNKTACIGNGRNDRIMLKKAVLGIAVLQGEGASSDSIMAADAVCPDILSALALLENPLRLTATLRI